MQKKSKNNFGNIFKIIIENRRIAVRGQNLSTESFKFILFQLSLLSGQKKLNIENVQELIKCHPWVDSNPRP